MFARFGWYDRPKLKVGDVYFGGNAMNREAREFLSDFGHRELLQRGILKPFGKRLTLGNDSVGALLDLMKEHDVEQIDGPKFWYLTQTGEYYNQS